MHSLLSISSMEVDMLIAARSFKGCRFTKAVEKRRQRQENSTIPAPSQSEHRVTLSNVHGGATGTDGTTVVVPHEVVICRTILEVQIVCVDI